MVCDDCNQYFGNNLELELARDTIEGENRYAYQIKGPDEYKSVGSRSRLTRKVAEGDFKGAYAHRKCSGGRLVAVLVPQIGFLKSSFNDRDYFMLDSLPDKLFLEHAGYNLDNPESIRVLGCDINTAKRKLQEKGITLKISRETIPIQVNGSLPFEIELKIDDIIFRAIAKIGFNYLAFWENSDFVVHSSFEPIRQYIRKWESLDYPLVVVTNNAILANELPEGWRSLGHIVTVNWAADTVSIVARVSLFNDMSYHISLAKEFSGEHRNIKRGHFFDVQNRRIIELQTKSKLC
jgi:hypothetical protein